MKGKSESLQSQDFEEINHPMVRKVARDLRKIIKENGEELGKILAFTHSSVREAIILIKGLSREKRLIFATETLYKQEIPLQVSDHDSFLNSEVGLLALTAAICYLSDDELELLCKRFIN